MTSCRDFGSEEWQNRWASFWTLKHLSLVVSICQAPRPLGTEMGDVLEELILGVVVLVRDPGTVIWGPATAGFMLYGGALRKCAGKEKGINDNCQWHDHDKGLAQTWFPQLLTHCHPSAYHSSSNPSCSQHAPAQERWPVSNSCDEWECGIHGGGSLFHICGSFLPGWMEGSMSLTWTCHFFLWPEKVRW